MSSPVSATEESPRSARAARVSLRQELLRRHTFGIPRVRLDSAIPPGYSLRQLVADRFQGLSETAESIASDRRFPVRELRCSFPAIGAASRLIFFDNVAAPMPPADRTKVAYERYTENIRGRAPPLYANLSPHAVAKAGLEAQSVHPLWLDTALRK